jgi:nucleotide-binding universal stress UspA family protein
MVCLSGGASDRQIVSYAAKLAELGYTRHFHFVHIHDVAKPVVSEMGTSPAGYLESLVAELFRPERSNVSSSCHVLSGDRIDRLIEFSVEQQCDLALLGHRASRSGQRRLARRMAMIAPCSVLMLPEKAPLSIQTVMAPTDLSEHSADSVRVAAAIAKAAGLDRCIVTHVYSDPSVIRYEEHKETLEKSEEASLRDFVAKIGDTGVALEAHLVEGNKIAESILFAAEQRGADLLVVNTRGRSKAAAILLGSVTSQLLAESPIAVLAVKHFGSMLNLFQALKEQRFLARENPQTN